MWFTEDALTPGALFGAIGMFWLLMGLNTGRVRHTVIGGLLMIVGAGAFVIDAIAVTERERLQENVVALCDDFRNRRAGTLDYFSKTAPELRLAAAGAMALVTVETAPSLTDFQIAFSNEGSRATSQFRANATISVAGYGNVGHQPSRFILTWAREGSEWKIIKVQRMHPIHNKELGLLDQSPG